MMKRSLRVGIYILFICLVVLISLELVARIFIRQPYYAFPEGYFVRNEFYGYALARNFKGTYSQPEFSISINTNSQGMRDREHAKDERAYKVLALGDSLAFGGGVELEDTYLSLLEKMPNIKGRKGFSIIKAGVPGYSTYNQRLFLEKEGIKHRPGMVMVQFWWDDLGVNHLTYVAEAGFLVSGKMRNNIGLRAFLNRHFRSYAFLRKIFTTTFNRAVFKTELPYLTQQPKELKEKFMSTVQEFKAIEKVCRDNRAECLFILIPSREFVYGRVAQKNLWQAFCNFLESKNVVFIDLMPAMEEVVREGRSIFFSVDPHLNQAGHEVVASELYKYFSSNR